MSDSNQELDAGNILDLPDDQIDNLDIEDHLEPDPETPPEDDQDDQEPIPEPKDGQEGASEPVGEPAESGQGDDPYEGDGDAPEPSDDEPVPTAEAEDGNSGDSAKKDDPTDPAKDQGTEATIDYEAEYKRLTSPFRANHTEMQVANVDDAITLMQMGANYNKKMHALKPSLRILKMLEKHELLDEEKISRLIDLDKKNPAAIKSLVKDSGLDPMQLEPGENEEPYKPSTYTVNDKEIDLDEVIAEIRDNDTFDRTIDVVSNKWDQASKKILLENPRLLSIIDDHIGKGYYETVMSIVETERALGRLPGMSDIQAYQHVGNVIQAQGGFNPSPAEDQPEVTDDIPIEKKPKDPALKKRKQAAGPTRGRTKAPAPDFNPLNMSDDDFEKMNLDQML